MSSKAFAGLLADFSTTFINLSAEQVQSGIVGGLGRIAEFLHLERATLYELSETKNELTATTWTRDETNPSPSITRADDPFRWTMLLERSGVLIASDPAALPEVWAASVPLTIGGETIGAMRVASTSRPLPWTDDSGRSADGSGGDFLQRRHAQTRGARPARQQHGAAESQNRGA